MKNTILFITLLLWISPIVTYGQSYELKLGKEHPLSKKNQVQPLSIESDCYYLLESTNKGEAVQKYDLNHKLISQKSVSLDFKGSPNAYRQLLQTKDGTYLYYSFWNSKSRQLELFVSKFENETLSPLKAIHQHKQNSNVAINIVSDLRDPTI